MGCELGFEEESLLGINVGLTVGCELGWAEENEIGNSEGVAVGLEVGVEVGESDG